MSTARRRLLAAAAAFAAALLAAAAPAGAASWTTPATITRAGDVQFDLAMGGDGTAALAWVHDGVQVAVKRPGRRWSSVRRVSDGRFGVSRPAVTVTGRGEVVVAWSQNGTRAGRTGPTVGPLTVRAAVRSEQGRWSDPRRLGSTAHFIDAQIDAGANARGAAIVVWRGVRTLSNGRRTDAIQSAYRPAGGPFGSTQTIRESAVVATRATPVVALDSRGTAYAAWTSGPRPSVRLAARSRGTSGSWLAARTLDAGPASNPQISVAPDRTAVIAWRASGLDSEGDGIQLGVLRSAARAPSGALSATQQLSDLPTRTIRMTVAPSGETVLGWAPAGGDLRIRTRPATAAGFGPEAPVAGVVPGDFHGGLAALGDATTLLTWDDGSRTRVLARPPGGAFAATPELDVAGRYPLVAASGRRAVVVWAVLDGERVMLAGAARSG